MAKFTLNPFKNVDKLFENVNKLFIESMALEDLKKDVEFNVLKMSPEERLEALDACNKRLDEISDEMMIITNKMMEQSKRENRFITGISIFAITFSVIIGLWCFYERQYISAFINLCVCTVLNVKSLMRMIRHNKKPPISE